MMTRIVPSIASADPLHYDEAIRSLNEQGSLHIDIEDGNFIPNITFGLKSVRAFRKATSMPFNAHLMVTNPMFYIKPLAESGVTELCFHIESTPYPLQVINEIRRYDMKAGLAVNFMTPVSILEPFEEDIDFILIMTAEEDGKGQLFHRSSLKRIREARKLLSSGKSLWVDGGINRDCLSLVRQAGADTVVMGRAVFGSPDPLSAIRILSA